MDAIFFDFDGVILESVDIKGEAFRDLFAHEESNLQQIVDLHYSQGGMSRYRKFEIIYNDILDRPLSKEQKEILGKRFAELVVQKVIACPFVSGAYEFLTEHYMENKLFIVSGTPDQELQDIVCRRDLDRYFIEIHGAPRNKTEIVLDILKRHNLSAPRVFFVGDAINDYDAAYQTGTCFIGRVPKNRENPFPDSTRIITDLTELSDAILDET